MWNYVKIISIYNFYLCFSPFLNFLDYIKEKLSNPGIYENWCCQTCLESFAYFPWCWYKFEPLSLSRRREKVPILSTPVWAKISENNSSVSQGTHETFDSNIIGLLYWDCFKFQIKPFEIKINFMRISILWDWNSDAI